MTATKFKDLLMLNRELGNTLYTMTDVEKASIKGGKVFRDLHKTDLRISKAATTDPKLNSIIEQGDY